LMRLWKKKRGKMNQPMVKLMSQAFELI
jgi:hypothetical protein